MTDVIVIGGGAAGCMAALAAAQQGVSVTLLERNEKIGRKLYLTGKGRCNLTNACPVPEVLAHVPRGARFLTSAMTRFPPEAVMDFFEGLGVPWKVERGNRVFPKSDRATDVIDALLRALRKNKVKLLHERVTALERDPKDGFLTGVRTETRQSYVSKAVVLATGGLSYPGTGSTGDGYALAKAVGHTIQPLRGSLVPLEAESCAAMQGLSLRNIGLKVRNQAGKTLFQDQGELLFTHFGLSGPLILRASAHLTDWKHERYVAVLDLKPALDEETLDRRLIRELTQNANRNIRHVLETLEPHSLLPAIFERAGLSGDEKANSLPRTARRELLTVLKGFSIVLLRPRPIEEAIITAGGVTLQEVSPKDMGSRLCTGLYLAGELLDTDACTGGFNLQIAWATGRAAGLGAADFCRKGSMA